MHRTNVETTWHIVLRMVVGTYWIYFSVMKWFDRSWVSDLLSTAANGSYFPGYNQLLKYAASNPGSIALVVTILETVIGLLILLGILTRVGATLGAFLGLETVLIGHLHERSARRQLLQDGLDFAPQLAVVGQKVVDQEVGDVFL